MQRLKHPVRSLREPFGKAGLTVAILALVLAMVGGAWAAAGLNSKQKKEVTKIAKKYAGKAGATGPAGTNGTNGSPGAPGKNGENGSPGAPGTSVTVTPLSFPNCNGQAGAKFTVGAQEAKACNGKNGTFGSEPLPSGQTLTGVWSVGPEPAESGVVGFVALASFPIPLPSEPTAHYINTAGEEVHFEPPNTPQTVCPGTEAEPAAEPGNFCVYEALQFHAELFTEGIFLHHQVGALVQFIANGSQPRALGTWAVTAP